MKPETVIIIGGCGGIGFSTCQYLSEQLPLESLAVIDVVEESIAKEKFQEINPKIKFSYHQCSIDDKSALETVFKKIKDDCGQINIVINAAGIVDEQNTLRTFNVNTIGTINATLVAVHHMRKDKGGSGGQIINIGSIASYTPTIRTPIYTASKYAVLGFTQSLAHPDFERLTGVKLSVICPGSTRTNISIYVGQQEALFPELHETYKEFSKNCPRQNPIDVARCILHAINANENGSVWEVVMGEIKKINA